ncbi:MAG: hypothetical protein L3J71_02665 [Victivallaceae bacterium]|nr:hypothetical protein [Victivallaceae bacterium]
MFFTASANAAVRRFRLGEILCAQMSKRMMSVANWNKLAFPANYNSKVYAVVVVKLDKGRSLSIYDYSLKQGYDTFPCVAIRKGSGSFNADTWKLDKSSSGDIYSMLFIVNIPGYSSSAKLDYTLTYNLSKSGIVKTKLDFKNLYYSSFTSINSIPKTGLLQGKK